MKKLTPRKPYITKKDKPPKEEKPKNSTRMQEKLTKLLSRKGAEKRVERIDIDKTKKKEKVDRKLDP